MPFQETCALDETVRFVSAYLAGEETMTALCRAFGISRQWGYELVRRYQAEGAAGRAPRSRAPHHPSRAMAAEMTDAIVGLRGEYRVVLSPSAWADRSPQQTSAPLCPGPAGTKGLVRNTTRNLSMMFPVQSVNEVSGCSRWGNPEA
jgi:hypothetical protein